METIDLLCEFCGTKVGEFTPPTGADAEAPLSAYGFVDLRCDSCIVIHGDYKEMHDLFLRDIGTHDQFIVAMGKSEKKLTKFAEVLAIEHTNKFIGKKHDFPRIEAACRKIEEDLGIDDLLMDEKQLALTKALAKNANFDKLGKTEQADAVSEEIAAAKAEVAAKISDTR